MIIFHLKEIIQNGLKGKGKENVIGIKKFLNTIYLLNYLYKFNNDVVEEVSEKDIRKEGVFGLHLTGKQELNKLNEIVSGQGSALERTGGEDGPLEKL